MVLGWSVSVCDRRHWPMHGPHALAKTVAPSALSVAIWPSRSIVARTRSEPGVTMKGVAGLRPWAWACCATSAARLISS